MASAQQLSTAVVASPLVGGDTINVATISEVIVGIPCSKAGVFCENI